MTCPVCANEQAAFVIDIPEVPVFCNQLCRSRQQALEAPRADIRLQFCHSCGHIFNGAFREDLVKYSPEYENTLHCSARFQQYAADLAEQLAARHELAKRVIVEVGCGDGQFLRGLCATAGAIGVGFDPSFQGTSGQTVDSVTIYRNEYQGERLDDAPALLCCRHCLEHVGTPHAFVRFLRQQLAEDCRVFFEVPNAFHTIRDGGIWDIVYEHCGYFTESSLHAVFTEARFEVTEVAEEFAGQFLVLHGLVAAPATMSKRAPVPEPLASAVAQFGALYRRKTAEFRSMLAAARDAGQRVAVWGGGTKGVMFLNTVGTGSEVVVDINPKKHGMFVAGTGQPIVAPAALKEDPPDLVVVMNAIYQDEIAATLRALSLEPKLLLA